MIKLGSMVRDKVTGMQGITTGRCEYLYGCAQYNIVTRHTDNNKSEVSWFDEGRIEKIGDGISQEDVQSEKDGGYNYESPGRQG